MNDTTALLKIFAERYINCDDEQAMFDAKYNREAMVAAYNAILHFAESEEKMKKNPNANNDCFTL